MDPRMLTATLGSAMAIQSLLQHMVGSSLLFYLAAGLVALLYFLTSSKKPVCSLPPGPRPLPLIGNLNVVDLKKPFQSLTEVGSARQAGGKRAAPEVRNMSREMEMRLCLHCVQSRNETFDI